MMDVWVFVHTSLRQYETGGAAHMAYDRLNWYIFSLGIHTMTIGVVKRVGFGMTRICLGRQVESRGDLFARGDLNNE